MRRMIFIFSLFGALMTFTGAVLGQNECKTPLFITTSVSPNVLIVFDTSGSMRNVIWHGDFDPKKSYHKVDSEGNDDPLLPVASDQVVFAQYQRHGSCSPSHHYVWRDRSTVSLSFYKVRTGSVDICCSSIARVESDSNGYFYFDRSQKRFINARKYIESNPNHVKVFLPYVNTGTHPSVSSREHTRYNYNYLNWIFYRSTKTQRDEIKRFFDEEQDRLTRILTAQNVIKEVVQNTTYVRFGVMRFNWSSGGDLIAPVGSDVDTIVSAVDRQWADGWTPLAETMEDVWEYFKAADGPIQDWCQKNFVILVTDGLPTMDSDNLSSGMKKNWDRDRGGSLYKSEENVYPDRGSDYLDDIAFYLFENDARPDLQYDNEIRNIRTFTIGLTTSNDLLLETAFNGNGVRDHMAEWDDPGSNYYHRFYYLADNFDELLRAIENALIEVSIVNSSGTAVSVISSSTSTDDLAFRASFNSKGWKGFLDAFELTDVQDFNQDKARWLAGELLQTRDPGDRQIYTALKSATGINNKLDFIEANVARTDAEGKQLFKLLNTTNANNGKDIIKFIRGGHVDGYRDREGYKLGDIVHSTPVVVGPPDGYFRDPSYVEFRREYSSRERMLYVGANDGMLHAFYVDDSQGGEEAWAFIPNNLLGKLKDLTSSDYDSCHKYFVDLTPMVADVFIDPDGLGQRWRTLLIGGEREGGKAYFALDVTDPKSGGPDDGFKPMWEFSHDHLGESWSVPFVEKIKLGENDKWLAFVGNGFNNDDRKGYLFAIDLESGKSFRMLELGPDSPSSPNVLASPRAVDIDGDDYADSLFVGDLYGRVWRFNITDQTGESKTYKPLNPADWEPQEIFKAKNVEDQIQPIILPVGLSFYCSGPSDQKCQNLITYFGTGRYLTTGDKTDHSLQSFYAIKDEFNGITRDQMEDRTLSWGCMVESDPYSIRGWYVDLTTPGERVSSPPLVMGGLVFFLTFIPKIDDPCSAGGTTYLYYREFDTGCVPNRTVFGEDPDPEGDARPVGKILIGPGYASEIVYYAKTQDMLIQTSDRTIHSRRVTLHTGGIENYAWREVFY